MPLMDKTGRNLRVGQWVDCFIMGRVTGEVVAIEEGTKLAGVRAQPPIVAVAFSVPFPIEGNTCPHVYVVKPALEVPESAEECNAD